MTPAQVGRAALCLADALAVVADERGREDACPEIIAAHSRCAQDLCWSLDDHTAGPDNTPLPCDIAVALEHDPALPVKVLEMWAEAYRTFGRNLLANCPVCEEPKGGPAGRMCADLHAEVGHGA